ncbi:MAG: iron-containing alcohol dehydrogenase [Bacteroidales bacterium]
MVKAFRFARLPEIVFRNGSIEELPGLIDKTGKPAIILTGKRSFTGTARGEQFFTSLKEKGINYYHIIIPGEPSPIMIDEAVEKYKNIDSGLVAAIGGGSVLDAGKAISAMLKTPGAVKEYLEGVGHKEPTGLKVPFIALPTTSGTGSEATKNAVISEVGPGGFKKSLRHDNYVPDVAILDPELTLECPKDITAASGMDCFTQLTEAFLSDKASAYTDAFAREGLKAIKTSLVRSVKNGDDIEARTGMSYAALNSGICLANAGLGTVHGFASTIGGEYDIPHGLVCGTLMAAANRVTVRELRKQERGEALRKYVELGKLFLDSEGENDDYYIDGFVKYLYELTDELELPRLTGFGINEQDLEVLSSKTGNKNNPVDLDLEYRKEILLERIK